MIEQATHPTLCARCPVRAELETNLNEFRDGLTDALNAHGVPATPSWRAALDWLATNGER